MRFVSVLTAMTLMLVISSCGNSGTKADNVKTDAESVQEQASASGGGGDNSAAQDKKEPKMELSEDEREEFTDIFNTPEYNGFLEESFSSPENINWDAVLRFGAGLSVKDIGEEEIGDYLKAVKQGKVYGDLLVVRRSDLGEYIKKHTGLNSIPDSVLSWDYVADRDSFYKEQFSSEPVGYTCIEGTREGDSYVLRFRVNSGDIPEPNAGKNYGRWADRILTLKMAYGEAVIESNAIQWDDYCDETQSFDVSFPQFEGPARFITYSVTPDKTSINIVKDGNLLADLSTSVYSEEGSSCLNTILAVGFFDFDYDGMNDIAVIGDSDLGMHALLYKAVSTEYTFESFADLDEKKAKDIGCDDFTIPSIKVVLLGDESDDSQISYQDMYTRIAKAYMLKNGEYKYDLIYADDSPDPGLVIDNRGYQMSLYTYKNGKTNCLMYDWPYGAGGNAGYSYAPGKGVFFNQNSDYAGAVMYVSYMLIHEGKELEADYAAEYLMFNDLDGDGSPSDDELAATEDFHTYSTKYFNYTDKKMTDAEIEEKIKELGSYDEEYISGTMDYNTLKSRLKK